MQGRPQQAGGRRGPGLWLALVTGLVPLVVLGWLFGEILEAVVEQDDLTTLDSPVTRWLVAHRTPWLTSVMRVVTQLGSAWFVVTLLTAVVVVMVARHRPWTAIMVPPLSSAGAATMIMVIKVLIARPRPTVGAIVATATGFSFPSGHSAQAVATYGALAWVATRAVAGPRRRPAVWAAATMVALLIGFSRMYLGVHWLSDVLGGYVLAAAWLAIVVTAVNTTTRVRARRLSKP